ncbi:hypothetical protein HPP92_006712 [Vanilla planifolia]|uniref:Uncharacterized protein n=1 Tax=Vanilla planifolia TaxID=51239 RepID=A0A835V712_VANPL|nr:hypothetical protein HPP92_006712 [Vanilla planifolia]
MEGAVVLRQLVREIQELWEFYERRQSSSLSMLPSVTLSCLLSLSFVERRGRWKVVEHVYFLASDEFVADAAVFGDFNDFLSAVGIDGFWWNAELILLESPCANSVIADFLFVLEDANIPYVGGFVVIFGWEF